MYGMGQGAAQRQSMPKYSGRSFAQKKRFRMTCQVWGTGAGCSAFHFGFEALGKGTTLVVPFRRGSFFGALAPEVTLCDQKQKSYPSG